MNVIFLLSFTLPIYRAHAVLPPFDADARIERNDCMRDMCAGLRQQNSTDRKRQSKRATTTMTSIIIHRATTQIFLVRLHSTDEHIHIWRLQSELICHRRYHLSIYRRINDNFITFAVMAETTHRMVCHFNGVTANGV